MHGIGIKIGNITITNSKAGRQVSAFKGSGDVDADIGNVKLEKVQAKEIAVFDLSDASQNTSKQSKLAVGGVQVLDSKSIEDTVILKNKKTTPSAQTTTASESETKEMIEKKKAREQFCALDAKGLKAYLTNNSKVSPEAIEIVFQNDLGGEDLLDLSKDQYKTVMNDLLCDVFWMFNTQRCVR